MFESSESISRRAFELINAGDAEGYLALRAHERVLVDNITGRIWRGPDEGRESSTCG